MWRAGLVAPRHVGSSRTRARTRVPCIGRWILNHCATREVPNEHFNGCCLYVLLLSSQLDPCLPKDSRDRLCFQWPAKRATGAQCTFHNDKDENPASRNETVFIPSLLLETNNHGDHLTKIQNVTMTSAFSPTTQSPL